MKEEKVLNLLHMSRKAGKLTLGFDACERSCHSGHSKLILVASDLAEKQKLKITSVAEAYNVKWVEIGTKKLLGEAFNTRNLGIISVDDQNFAKGIKKWIS